MKKKNKARKNFEALMDLFFTTYRKVYKTGTILNSNNVYDDTYYTLWESLDASIKQSDINTATEIITECYYYENTYLKRKPGSIMNYAKFDYLIRYCCSPVNNFTDWTYNTSLTDENIKSPSNKINLAYVTGSEQYADKEIKDILGTKTNPIKGFNTKMWSSDKEPRWNSLNEPYFYWSEEYDPQVNSI